MKSTLILGLMLASSLALAECDRPTAPALPDGETADLQTMVDGQKAVKSYVAEAEAYLDCINAETAAAGEGANPDEQLARIEKHNAVVDEMETVAAAFNEEIREYKAQAQ